MCLLLKIAQLLERKFAIFIAIFLFGSQSKKHYKRQVIFKFQQRMYCMLIKYSNHVHDI